MRPFERCRRDLRRALCAALLAVSLGAWAQAVPCSQVPQEDQARARASGRCVDAALPAAKKAVMTKAEAVARAAAAKATMASGVKGAPPAFQCAALPDFAAKRLTYEQALQVMKALPPGLFRPRIRGRSPSSAAPDVVIAQSTEPLDGRLCWASFVLSDGSLATIAVPGVVGRGLAEARSVLARFSVQTRQQASVLPAGEVLAQAPPGETQARPGSPVLLTLSDGSLVEAPDVVKLALAAARGRLEQAGLRIDAVDDASGMAPGTVTRQEPPAHTEVRRDSVVTLQVSIGLSLPDVVGRSVADARATLQSFSVHEERVASDHAEGEVLDQSPPARSRVGARSRVTLRISDGSIVTVPPLHGATLADARAALQRAGDLNATTPNGDEAGTMLVDTSSPVAGLRVRRGSTVALTLVPVTPWRAWAAGIATLLVLGGAGLYKWRRPKVALPTPPTPPVPPVPPAADAHFSPSLEFNIRPIEARAGGPEVPAIGLRAELVPGRPWARYKGEST